MENTSPTSNTLQLREEAVRACLFLSDKGHFIGTWGNVSACVAGGFIITPSAVDCQTMCAEDFVVISTDGDKICGKRVPSSETELHRRLLLRRPDLGAFVHTHSPYVTCAACAQKSIPVIVEDTFPVPINASILDFCGDPKPAASAIAEVLRRRR